MVVYLFASGGLVDEVLVTDGALAVRRTGTARYVARFDEAHAAVEVELWTSRKGRVRADAWPDCPSWVHVTMGAGATLDAIDATGVDVHLEHMDRGIYFIGFTRGGERWGLSLASDGYIKTRIRGGTVTPHRRAR